MRAKRLDINAVKFGKAEKRPNGFLHVPIRATRTGVFKYVMSDGSIRRELRLPEEVFKEESMATLSNVSITDDHPKGMVNAKNAKRLSIGFTGDTPIKDKNFLAIKGVITDEKAIQEIDEKGSQEVSCGYTAELEETSGVWEGETYDAIQRNIEYNHLALVDQGRAGPEARLILDSQDAVLYNESISIQRGDSMKVKIGDKEFEVSDEAGKAINDMMKKHDEEMSKLKASKDACAEEKDKAEGKADSLKKDLDKETARADSLEAKNKTLEEEKKTVEEKMDNLDLDKMVSERANLVEKASKFLPEEKFDGVKDIEVKKKVVAHVLKDVKLDEKSDEYINASFETLTIAESKTDKLADAFNKKAEKEDNKETSFGSDELTKSTEDAYKTKF